MILQIPLHISFPSGYIWWSSHPSHSFIWYFYRLGITSSHPFHSKTAWSCLNLISHVQSVTSLQQHYPLHRKRLLFPESLFLYWICFPFGWELFTRSEWFLWAALITWQETAFSVTSVQVLIDLISDVWDVFGHSEWADIRTSFSRSVGSHLVKCQCFNGCLLCQMWQIYHEPLFSLKGLYFKMKLSVCIRHVRGNWGHIRIFRILWPITKGLTSQGIAAENNYIYSWNKTCIDSLSDFISIQRMALNALKH